MRLYIDGNLNYFIHVHGSIATNDSSVVIGDKSECSGGNRWNDLIDNVCFYSYALSTEEVKGLYEGKEPPREKKSE